MGIDHTREYRGVAVIDYRHLGPVWSADLGPAPNQLDPVLVDQDGGVFDGGVALSVQKTGSS